MDTLLNRINKLPPAACRLLARSRHGWHGLSHQELATKAGLARSTVAKISRRQTWNGLTIDTIERFSTACGVNLISPASAIRIIRSRKMPFLRKSPSAQRRFYISLFKTAA